MPAAAPAPSLDLISIGRSSVDLYGQQIGGRLEDMGTFSKAVGGCPTNIAIGTARLGLRSAVITRVGDEHMGRFIREQLQREGVDVHGVHTDPARLTALVVLGVRDDKSFPLIFYRDNCADSALDESDIDEAFIASAGAVVVTGTHFAHAASNAAQRKAMRIARAHGRRVVFDVDYRPNLWGLAGHGAGESRYIHSDDVTKHLAPILPDCDLIVGTEEELHIAGGRWGASCSPARSPTASRTVCAGRDFRWKSTTCWAPATPSCPASCAAGCAANRSKPAAPMPTRVAPSPSRACCARRKARPGPSFRIF